MEVLDRGRGRHPGGGPARRRARHRQVPAGRASSPTAARARLPGGDGALLPGRRRPHPVALEPGAARARRPRRQTRWTPSRAAAGRRPRRRGEGAERRGVPRVGDAGARGHLARRRPTRSCWSSRTCTGPTPRRSRCCASSSRPPRPGHHLAVLVTRRPWPEPTGALAEVGEELARQHVTRLDLGGLTLEEARALVDAVAGRAGPGRGGRGVARTLGGQPVLPGRAGPARVPDSRTAPALPATVRDVIVRRLEDLPERHRQLLLLAAVLGRRFSLDLLAAVAGAARGGRRRRAGTGARGRARAGARGGGRGLHPRAHPRRRGHDHQPVAPGPAARPGGPRARRRRACGRRSASAPRNGSPSWPGTGWPPVPRTSAAPGGRRPAAADRLAARSPGWRPSSSSRQPSRPTDATPWARPPSGSTCC